MSTVQSPNNLLRDQRRARDAYRMVGEVSAEHRAEYRTLILDLGPAILRLGLCGALSRLEGDKRGAARVVLENLAGFDIVGIGRVPPNNLAGLVRGLTTDKYMLATRGCLQAATWLRRAVQALLPDLEVRDHAQ